MVGEVEVDVMNVAGMVRRQDSQAENLLTGGYLRGGG